MRHTTSTRASVIIPHISLHAANHQCLPLLRWQERTGTAGTMERWSDEGVKVPTGNWQVSFLHHRSSPQLGGASRPQGGAPGDADAGNERWWPARTLTSVRGEKRRSYRGALPRSVVPCGAKFLKRNSFYYLSTTIARGNMHSPHPLEFFSCQSHLCLQVLLAVCPRMQQNLCNRGAWAL